MLEIEFGFITIIMVYGVIYFINYKLSFSKTQNKTNQVHLPKIYLWVGLLDAVFFTFPFLINCFFHQISIGFNWFPVTVFSLFILLGLILVVEYFNCRIEIGQDDFIYHTFFGRSYKIRYSDIKKIKRTNNTIHLYTNKKHLFIDNHSNGLDDFIARIK